MGSLLYGQQQVCFVIFPGEIMDEKMSYKEFLDRNDSWSAEERELCFRPMDMADPFSMHRGENLPDLSFPTDMKNVPLFPGHAEAARDILAPHGSMMGPEQPFLGSLYTPAEALDPSAFMGLESGTEFLPGKAGAASVPDIAALPAQRAGAGDPTPAPAASNPFQAMELGFSAAPEASPPKADVESHQNMDLGFAPAADVESHQNMDLGFAPAADVESHQNMDWGFAPAAEPHHALDLGFAPEAENKAQHVLGSEFGPAAEVNHQHALDPELAPAAPAKPVPAVDAGEVAVEAQAVPAAAPSTAVSGELLTSQAAPQQDKCPAEATTEMGAESKVPEICEDPSGKMKEKDRKPPPSPDEKAPGTGSSQAEAAAEAKGALENKDLPEKSAPAENGETQKEEAEHNHIQRAEPQEGKTLQEPTEDGGKSTDGGRADEAGKEGVYPENGQAVPAGGQPSAPDKPKKRGSDGRSRKGERSFCQQPFPEKRMDAGSCAEVADEGKEGSDKGREGGSVPAGGLQDNTAEMQRPIELGSEKPKENTGKGERADLGALDQALLLENGREEAKNPAVAATISPSKQEDGAGRGREAGGAAGLSSALAHKGRKRSSDGRRKQPERSPCGQAAVLAAGGDSRDTGWDKEKGSALQRERQEPKIQGSCSEQPSLSGHKTESSQPGIGSAKEIWPGNEGKEADKSQALPEHRAGVPSPTKELGMDKARSKSREGKGRKAEHSAGLGPGDSPAVGHVQQAQAEKGKENSRTPAALLGHLPDPAKVQAPALPLEPGKSPTGGEEKHRKGEPEPQQPSLLEHGAGAGVFSPPGLEIRDKPEAGGARNKNAAPEQAAGSEPSLAPHTSKEKETQEITKEKESQEITKEKDSQEGAEEKGSQDTAKEKECQAPARAAAAGDQRAAGEAKKERGKVAEQLKGYMRPTRARGGTALVARPRQDRGV
ncbi:hypothetical protein TURU_057156 [Turdus rufiventris]|nr:hypothetical protein TURU_057156 [Turdus rufiventris]